MKSFQKTTILVLVFTLAAGLMAWAQTVDTYSSASESSSKTTLAGAAFEAAAKALQMGSSDLADKATATKAGYVAPKSLIGNVMSANPDGSVGISTISQWKYEARDGADVATLQLTQGQNALNLAAVNKRGTLFVPGVTVDGKSLKYFVHFKVTKVDELKYSDDAFKAGKFNSYYSGQAGKKSQYTLMCQVLAIEEVSGSVKLSVVFP